MKNLSKTRWIGRTESIKAVRTSYEILIDILDDMKVTRESLGELEIAWEHLLSSTADIH